MDRETLNLALREVAGLRLQLHEVHMQATRRHRASGEMELLERDLDFITERTSKVLGYDIPGGSGGERYGRCPACNSHGTVAPSADPRGRPVGSQGFFCSHCGWTEGS